MIKYSIFKYGILLLLFVHNITNNYDILQLDSILIIVFKNIWNNINDYII